MTQPQSRQEALRQLDDALDHLRSRNIDMTRPEMVGTLLRDEYGIPNVKEISGQKLCQYLKLDPLRCQYIRIKDRQDWLADHCKKNKKDVPAQRALAKLTVRVSKTKSRVRLHVKESK